ncbi:hypothetical protein ACSBR1_013509 [Camellia fascicularis]
MAFATIYCSRTFSACLEANKKRKVSPILPSNPVVVIDVFEPPHPCFSNIDKSSLTQLVNQKNLTQLVEKYDGVEGLASALKTNLEHGINGDDKEDILHGHEAFGTNTYRRPPTKCFYGFVLEALKDHTLSLGFGVKENGLKEGWYEEGSIFVAVFVVIAVSAGSNFKQNRQFLNLSKVSNNIPIDVVRNGRRKQVLIFEIVVGDVVCLKIGDQVPAYRLFIDGHLLQVDESSMTGESEHVEVNLN